MFSRLDLSVLQRVNLINSFVSSQRLYYLLPQESHPLLPLGNIPQYLSRWKCINCYLPTCRYNNQAGCKTSCSKILTNFFHLCVTVKYCHCCGRSLAKIEKAKDRKKQPFLHYNKCMYQPCHDS